MRESYAPVLPHLILGVGTSLVLGGLCVRLAVTDETYRLLVLRSPALNRVVGTAGAIIMGTLFVMFLTAAWHALRGRPALLLDNEGVTIWMAGPRWHAPWSSIESVTESGDRVGLVARGKKRSLSVRALADDITAGELAAKIRWLLEHRV